MSAFVEVLRIRRTALGPAHPDVASTLTKLGLELMVGCGLAAGRGGGAHLSL